MFSIYQSLNQGYLVNATNRWRLIEHPRLSNIEKSSISMIANCQLPYDNRQTAIIQLHSHKFGLNRGPSDPEADDIPMCHHASQELQDYKWPLISFCLTYFKAIGKV